MYVPEEIDKLYRQLDDILPIRQWYARISFLRTYSGIAKFVFGVGCF